ncbi:MAG: hypothetical protein AAF213_07270 [Pseudomonadota bacterium]
MRDMLKNVVLMICSLALTLVGLEVALRLVDGEEVLTKTNFVARKLSLLSSSYPTAYDPLMGYIPQPDHRGEGELWGVPISIDSRGLRLAAADAPELERYDILAMGDSFTFGDEVGDGDTWPAHLSTLTNKTVVNGGVFGYGLDQVLLRTEQLVPALEPEIVVMSVLYGDMRRSQLAQRTGVEKPYFSIENDALVLNNVPPSRYRPRLEQIGRLRTILGHSYLVDFTMRRVGQAAWWYADGSPEVFAHNQLLDVSCKMAERFAQFATAQDFQPLIVIQYFLRVFVDPQGEKSIMEMNGIRQFMACAEAAGLPVLDTFPMLQQAFDNSVDAGQFVAIYVRGGHMSSEGNRVIAQLIAERLAEEGWLEPQG